MAGLVSDHVIPDRAYDADALIAYVIEQGGEPLIPPRKSRKEPREYDDWLYRERHLVECLINQIKHDRHLFSRFDKLATRFLGFLGSVGALIWLR